MTVEQRPQDKETQSRSRRNKVYSSFSDAVSDVASGAVLLVSGFAGVGWPETLLRALHSGEASRLTLICQGVWSGPTASVQTSAVIEELVADGRVAKLVSSLPFSPGCGSLVEREWGLGNIELEVIPQGVLAERIRAGGAGLGGIFLPMAADTRFAEGKEVRKIGGLDHVFEQPLRADFALLRARHADTLGNLTYLATQRNWNPVMAMAAQVSIVEVDAILEPGKLDPEVVITPGIFVDRIVLTE